jgi:hypothetical protein
LTSTQNPEGRATEAGLLAIEVLTALDSGQIQSVLEYETCYGVLPEGPFPEDGDQWRMKPASAEEFEALRQRGRKELRR